MLLLVGGSDTDSKAVRRAEIWRAHSLLALANSLGGFDRLPHLVYRPVPRTTLEAVEKCRGSVLVRQWPTSQGVLKKRGHVLALVRQRGEPCSQHWGLRVTPELRRKLTHDRHPVP